jgi:hypothetical protein
MFVINSLEKDTANQQESQLSSLPKGIVEVGDNSALDPIAPAIEIIHDALPQSMEMTICGGFARDQFQNTQFNDVDIWIQHSPIPSLKQVIEKLKKSKRFIFSDRTNEHFVECFFCDDKKYQTGRPLYKIQLLTTTKDPLITIHNFDYVHCQFFIPIRSSLPLQLRHVYATEQAVQSIQTQQLKLTEVTTRELNKHIRYNNSWSSRFQIEKYVGRASMFKSRGMEIEPATLQLLTAAVETQIGLYEKYSGRFFGKPHASALLDPIIDYSSKTEGSDYLEQEILLELARHMILLHDRINLAVFLVSPHHLIRDAAKQLYEEQK